MPTVTLKNFLHLNDVILDGKIDRRLVRMKTEMTLLVPYNVLSSSVERLSTWSYLRTIKFLEIC